MNLASTYDANASFLWGFGGIESAVATKVVREVDFAVVVVVDPVIALGQWID